MNFKKTTQAVVLCVSLSLLASCLPARHANDVLPQDTPAMLHPGDSVKVLVWRNPELSGGFLVADDGTVRHPLYQAVHVAGIPLDSVQAHFGAFLSQYATNPQFVVQSEFRIVVRGEVRSPAIYTVPLETTLGGAIAAAGGPTSDAQLRKVTLVRDQHTYQLDLSDPAAPWTASPIRSGDQIIIGRKSNLFFGTILPLITAGAALASLISVLRRY
ncbi:MAG: polysaccharide biosynthesis/export family protein [Gemmatimonadaceae bacterium]